MSGFFEILGSNWREKVKKYQMIGWYFLLTKYEKKQITLVELINYLDHDPLVKSIDNYRLLRINIESRHPNVERLTQYVVESIARVNAKRRVEIHTASVFRQIALNFFKDSAGFLNPHESIRVLLTASRQFAQALAPLKQSNNPSDKALLRYASAVEEDIESFVKQLAILYFARR